MSFSIELPKTCTFSLCIGQDNRIFVDAVVEVPATSAGVAKAKKTIQYLMDEHAPVIEAIETEKASALKLENQPPINPAGQSEPEAVLPPPLEKKPEGVRGLLHLHCEECGRTFGTFLREHQTKMDCKCGHQIDLSAPLARYRFTCPYCEKECWGQTNLEAPDITVRCKCGRDVTLEWTPPEKEYRN